MAVNVVIARNQEIKNCVAIIASLVKGTAKKKQ